MFFQFSGGVVGTKSTDNLDSKQNTYEDEQSPPIENGLIMKC